jgi:MYXO-CTERM domain-containing protein
VPKTGGEPTIIYQLKETDGYSPQATLLVGRNGPLPTDAPDQYLYGTTYYAPRVGLNTGYGSGTVFKVKQDGTGFTTLHTFDVPLVTDPVTGNPLNVEGMHPTKALIQDATYLYGVNSAGGANGTGTVFKIAKNGGAVTVLHTFNAIETDAPSAGKGKLNDGAFPSASLTLGLNGANKLYGVTSGGGQFVKTSAGPSTTGTGTIFTVNTDGTGYETLYSFTALDDTTTVLPGINADGVQPTSQLLELASTPGVFIGTATDGGTPTDTTATGAGTVFRFDSATKIVTPLYNFDTNHGASPTGDLVSDGGLVYGMVASGSATGITTTTPVVPVTQFGAFYSIDPTVTPAAGVDNPSFKIVHALTFAEGSGFTGSLIKGTDGDLYGTVQAGNGCTAVNGSGYGAVFRYSLTTGGTSTGYVNCTQPSDSGGGAMSTGFLWLLALLGLAPIVRRRMFGFR